MTTRVFLPAHVADWISERLPLVDIERIQFRVCRRIPFNWLIGNIPIAGITFWNRVYLVQGHWRVEPPTRSSLELVVHELVHVVQYRRNPLLFPFRYVMDHFRYGYENNPAEVEARALAARVADSFFV